MVAALVSARQILERFHGQRWEIQLQKRQALSGQLDEFAKAVHASLDLRPTAFAIANEGRRLIGCDRVSVAIRRGRKCRIAAISGQDVLNYRSNTVRLMDRLANAVMATGEGLWYTGESQELPPQIETRLNAYLDVSHSKLVGVLPIYGSDDDQRRGAWPLGVMIVEQIIDVSPVSGFPQRAEVVRKHGGLALANALQHDGIFLLPLWRLLGRLGLTLRAGALPKTLAFLALLATIAAVLILVPYDFDLEGRGELQPVVRRDVFARVKGQVVDVQVSHMDSLSAGSVLVVMRSSELQSTITELQGQIQAKQEELNALEAIRIGERASLTPAEEKRLTGRKHELIATLRSLREASP